MPKFDVTAFLDQHTSVQEVSKLFEGLWRLERRGLVRFDIHPERTRAAYPRVVRFSALRDGAERTIAIDVSDQRDLVHLPDLEDADIYFKRSFDRAAVARLPHGLAPKVEPFGLNNPAVSVPPAMRILRARAATGRAWRDLARDARQLLALPSPAAFECAPHVHAPPLVLLQTALWRSEAPDTDALNQQRITLVRALRKALGNRFIGGIVPDEFSTTRCPDLLTNLPFRMGAYPGVVKRALIGIYVRGLHNSLAFKMSEYLAASRCIVAEPPSTVLPGPLTEGENYLPFRTPDECIERCEQLLSNPARAAEMRMRNWTYYRTQVEPAAHMLRILERSFG